MSEVEILGVKLDTLSKQSLLNRIAESISKKEKFLLYTVNNEFIVEANSNHPYKQALNRSTCSIADSTGVVWAVKKLHQKTIERIPGADLFIDLLELADSKKYSIFLLGGGKGVGELTKKKISMQFPNIPSISYLDEVKISPLAENKDIIDVINKSGCEMLFVALGSPKQELLIDSLQSKLKCSLMIGVGGTFDYYSGKIKRAPDFMKEMGLEWLYRLIKQPARAKRIYKALITFPLLVLRGKRD